MRKFTLSILALAITLAMASVAGAQTASGDIVFVSSQYNFGFGSSSPLTVYTYSGSVAGGSTSGTLTLTYGTAYSGPGAKAFVPIATNVPIAIDTGAAYEVVTPSAVSCSTPSQVGTCSFTATFANPHGPGSVVRSGDQGIQEAINAAAASGGGAVQWFIDSGDPLVLSTSAANTTFGINIPTRSTVMGGTLLVTTTITGCAGGWSLGFSSGTEFGAANTNLTAGSSTDSSTLVAAYAFNAAATKPEVHCTTGDATAGAVHARVWGYKQVAPAN